MCKLNDYFKNKNIINNFFRCKYLNTIKESDYWLLNNNCKLNKTLNSL